MDNASDYGSEDSRFESWQVRKHFFSHMESVWSYAFGNRKKKLPWVRIELTTFRFLPWSCDYETDALPTALPRLLGTWRLSSIGTLCIQIIVRFEVQCKYL